MNGITREDRIKNKYVRGSIGIPPIVDKIRQRRRKRYFINQ
jgi:hypothetical protein